MSIVRPYAFNSILLFELLFFFLWENVLVSPVQNRTYSEINDKVKQKPRTCTQTSDIHINELWNCFLSTKNSNISSRKRLNSIYIADIHPHKIPKHDLVSSLLLQYYEKMPFLFALTPLFGTNTVIHSVCLLFLFFSSRLFICYVNHSLRLGQWYRILIMYAPRLMCRKTFNHLMRAVV